MVGSRWEKFNRIASQLEIFLKVGEIAQPLPLLRPIVTPTMGGLMDLRAPTSAICTLRWANVVSLVTYLMIQFPLIRTRPTLPAFREVGVVSLTGAVIRQDFHLNLKYL